SASSDPDGDPLSFQWKDAQGNTLGTTALLHLNLTAGDHTLTLRVTDPDGAFSEDQVLVTVEAEPNRAPVADAGPNRTVKTRAKKASVRLDGRKSSDPEGDALTFTWMEGARQLATGATPLVKLAKGRHRITLTVRDPYQAPNTDQVVITVKKR